MATGNGRAQHTTLDGLASRVTGLETSNGELREQVREQGEATGRKIEGVSEKIDRWQESFQNRWDAQRNNRPDYGPLGVAVTVLLAIGGIVYGGLTANISRDDSAIEGLKASRYTNLDASKDLEAVRQRFDRDEDTNRRLFAALVSNNQFAEFKERVLSDEDRLEKRIIEIDASLVKRPEIEAANRAQDNQQLAAAASANQRINSLSARANSTDAKIERNCAKGAE